MHRWTRTPAAITKLQANGWDLICTCIERSRRTHECKDSLDFIIIFHIAHVHPKSNLKYWIRWTIVWIHLLFQTNALLSLINYVGHVSWSTNSSLSALLQPRNFQIFEFCYLTDFYFFLVLLAFDYRCLSFAKKLNK